jgi:hypothetical protein
LHHSSGVDVKISDLGVRFLGICAGFRMIGLVSSADHQYPQEARGREVMAAVAEVRTFWSALLSVLLKCIAALGFTTAGRTDTADRAAATAQGRDAAVAEGRTAVPATTARAGAPGGPAGTAAGRIPAPRAYGMGPRTRSRTLPPTMKQRISAEAHGSSPSARSLRPADGTLDEDLADTLTPAGAAPAAVPAQGAAAYGASPVARTEAVPAGAARNATAGDRADDNARGNERHETQRAALPG